MQVARPPTESDLYILRDTRAEENCNRAVLQYTQHYALSRKATC